MEWLRFKKKKKEKSYRSTEENWFNRIPALPESGSMQYLEGLYTMHKSSCNFMCILGLSQAWCFPSACSTWPKPCEMLSAKCENWKDSG